MIRIPVRHTVPLLLLLALSACGGGRRYAWDGRRGYDGNGDYGYDLNASRAEARSYRYHAARNYPRPGPPGDPWGPYITEAATRFSIPERWIREVMRQESGGRLESADGSLTTSGVGAMGLMQVMPATYDTLRRHYGLGDDPYEPHDNIMAGAAYIREMYDQFGSPGFLAAYNAGPDRLASYLAGGSELPNETVNYLASIAPRLGTEVAMTGPLSVYAGGASGGGRYAVLAENDPADRAYAGGGMSGVNYYSGSRGTVAATYTPKPRPAPAYQPSVQVAAYTPPAPTPVYTAPVYRSAADTPPPAPYSPPRPATPPLFAQAEAAEPVRAAPRISPAAMLVPLAAPGSSGVWGVQVGAFPDPRASQGAVQAARGLTAMLAGAQSVVVPVAHGGGTLYRARLTGLSAETAALACQGLTRRGMACFTVPPGS